MFSLTTLHRVVRALPPLRPCSNYLRSYSDVAPALTPTPQPPHLEPKRPRIIFSGIQPTGVPHLGNYLGALQQWVKLQQGEEDDVRFFSIVDLHAITVRQDPVELARWRKEMFASLFAIGLDPEKSTVFLQSSVPAHSELMWLLSCDASMGYLGRMTQWKLSLPSHASPTDKSSQQNALKLGLFSYPVLQAADILLYQTTHVPVGEDQAQHLEFARNLANAFNHQYASPNERILAVPKTLLSPAKRIMSLTEPTKKMSKSAPNPNSRILITDSKDKIHAKLRTALTDSIEGVSYDREARPGVTNLIDIMYHMNEPVATSPEDLAKDMEGLSMRALKEKVADTVDDKLRDIRERYDEIMGAQEEQLVKHAASGASMASSSANRNILKIKAAMGMPKFG
ncbi:hypothetical protein J1614_005179 [Plenodomus biglobosus]|nr:hypothetical protein J1614_005179 [Plenodomus biglobosus]